MFESFRDLLWPRPISDDELRPILSSCIYALRSIKAGTEGKYPIFKSRFSNIPVWDDVYEGSLTGAIRAATMLREKIDD